ncbi:EPIDERMAL PATTERNING FACTOR-like protein 8, partial [Mucuna pruriens]
MLDTRDEGLEQSKIVIGSKPPACVNKCKNCRPCMATLVVPNHQKRKGFKVASRGDDDTYYLLSWKCKCGDKLFQP